MYKLLMCLLTLFFYNATQMTLNVRHALIQHLHNFLYVSLHALLSGYQLFLRPPSRNACVVAYAFFHDCEQSLEEIKGKQV